MVLTNVNWERIASEVKTVLCLLLSETRWNLIHQCPVFLELVCRMPMSINYWLLCCSSRKGQSLHHHSIGPKADCIIDAFQELLGDQLRKSNCTHRDTIRTFALKSCRSFTLRWSYWRLFVPMLLLNPDSNPLMFVIEILGSVVVPYPALLLDITDIVRSVPTTTHKTTGW